MGVGKSQDKVRVVRDRSSTSAVAPKGGKCRVLVLELATSAVVTSDCWLLNVGVEFEINGKQNKRPIIILVNNKLDAQFFVYIYFYSLHVSGSHVTIIRRIIVINVTPGLCHSV